MERTLAGSAAGLALGAVSTVNAAEDRRVVIGLMGLQRGMALALGFARLPNVEVKYVCDVDAGRLASGQAKMKKTFGKTPLGVGDFRRILDDKEVDALVCAAPKADHLIGQNTIKLISSCIQASLLPCRQ